MYTRSGLHVELGSFALKTIGGQLSGINLPLFLKIIYLVFKTFTASLLTLNQMAILFSSMLTSFIKLLRFFPDFKADVSSANISVSRFVVVHRSLIKHRNNIGPSILPCNTEMFKLFSSEKVPLMSTNCFLSDK